ncbi:hypothetical protein QQS21_009595 [Conoideocrella luteorostrata]|uniref:Peptidase A1 domain-containing protein n=1 Tax=Conoideocrella luteorostrata TaxID=1105319 RepID=A0AAJ0FUX3_9HYPO|nr:hypothetical protein QQS21_009595 [Conoideocrella luteorostrata]
MNTFTAAVLLLGTVTGSLAAPAKESGITFSVQAIHGGIQRHVLADIQRTFYKYVPADTVAALRAAGVLNERDTGSVITRPEPNADNVDNLYLTEVSIGNPAQKLNLDFDTGSSDLWVFSTDTDSSQVNGQTLYRPADSSSANLQEGKTWSIRYGDSSSSSGIVYSDDVTIGGLTFKGQAVESAQKVSDQFAKDNQNSGLLGLALDKGNTIKPTKGKTWFSNVLPKLDQPLFTVRLRHNAEGSYNFGYIDKAQYSGTINYTPAFTDPLGHRLFNSTGYAVGTSNTVSTPIKGTADTGTSLLILDPSVATDYWSKVPDAEKVPILGGAGSAWVFPCSTTLPTFSFNIGNGKITVPSADLNYQPTINNLCVGGIATLDGLNGLSIFGDVALKSSFVVYDDGKSQLGWAQGV